MPETVKYTKIKLNYNQVKLIYDRDLFHIKDSDHEMIFYLQFHSVRTSWSGYYRVIIIVQHYRACTVYFLIFLFDHN